MSSYRPNIDLPGALVDDVQALAVAQGVNATYVWWYLINTAARMAERGHGELLPQERRGPLGTLVGGTKEARWRTTRDAYRRDKESIERAGSSVSAVLRHGGRAYVAAGGDLVAMSWPSKRATLAAA